MGFLLFAYRKLSLKRQINQKTYHQMLLANQQKSINAQKAAMEQAKAAMQSAWTTISSSLSDSTNTIFQSQVEGYSNSVQSATKNYRAVYDEALAAHKGDTRYDVNTDTKVLEAKAAVDNAREANIANSQKAYYAMQAAQQGLVFTNQMVNSVFAAADKGKLAMIQAQDQRIELDMAQTDSELKLLQAELEKVEKAEDQAAKDTAPSFGLA